MSAAGRPPELTHLVVRAPNWIGDAFLALGALRDLRRNFPAARLEVLARGGVAELYGALPEVEGVLPSLGLRADSRLLRGRCQAVVLLPNSLGSALPAWLARVPHRWGYATQGRAALLTRAARPPDAVRGRSQVYYYRAMLAGIGLEVAARPDTMLRCPPSWSAAGEALLAEAGLARGPAARPLVGLSPGAFFGGAKRWLPERFAALGDLLARRLDVQPVLLGAARERPLGEAIAGLMRSPAVVLAGRTTLASLGGVLSRLALLVTNDSGPMHFAAALGVPLVALFGPTNWRETAPQAERARVLHADVPCAPCKLRECPVDHACMRALAVEPVARAAEELLVGTA